MAGTVIVTKYSNPTPATAAILSENKMTLNGPAMK